MVIPDRGDVIWVDFDPQVGREQAGRRPALVLTPARYSTLTGMAIVCPITSRSKGYAFEIPIPAGLVVSGVILCDQIRVIDLKLRNTAAMTVLPRTVVDDVTAKLITLI